MPVLGIHAHALAGSHAPDAQARAIATAAAAGYALIELPLDDPRTIDPATYRAALHAAGIDAACSVTLPRAAHMSFYPEHARAWLGRALEQADALGARWLVGALAYAPGLFTGEPATLQERAIVAEVLNDLADDALARGITLAVEPANRYETYFLNTLADALDIVQGADNDALRLLADTCHMHIEEQDSGAALAEAGRWLGYVQVSESHRGLPGTGAVQWDAIWQGLAAADYDGPLVLETYGNLAVDVAYRLRAWRTPDESAEQIARAGLAFLRNGAAALA